MTLPAQRTAAALIPSLPTEDLVALRSTAKAAAVKYRDDAEKRFFAEEVALRSFRELGRRMADDPEYGPGRQMTNSLTYGLPDRERARWAQALARKPDEWLEDFIDQHREELDQLTEHAAWKATLIDFFSSATANWNTPQHIILAVLTVMDAIDLDPCSDSATHPNVPAAAVYTEADSGLTHEWHGRVYMNPPYGNVIGDWVRHLVDEYEAGRTTEAIALVPARTDTDWWRVVNGYPWCGIYGRLRFGDAETGAPFPSAAFYLGDHLGRFTDVFATLGAIYDRRYPEPSSQL